VTFFPSYSSQPLDGVLARLSMLVIFIIIWRFYPNFKLPGMRLGRLNRKRLPLLIYGLLLGSFTLVLFYTGKILLGHGFIDVTRILEGNVLRTLFIYIVGAVAIAFFEEIFFRGILYNAFKKDKLTHKCAPLLAAVFFGSMHFVDFKWLITWQAGKESLIDAFTSPRLLLADTWIKFLLIAALGLLLIYIYEKCGNLWAAIGLHAGMVFGVRVTDKIVMAYPGHSVAIFTTQVLDIGLIIVVLLLIAAIISGTCRMVRNEG
jgi:membrane protease YdiL (CAAX protease family)